jgi:hypothetical protein
MLLFHCKLSNPKVKGQSQGNDLALSVTTSLCHLLLKEQAWELPQNVSILHNFDKFQNQQGSEMNENMVNELESDAVFNDA